MTHEPDLTRRPRTRRVFSEDAMPARIGKVLGEEAPETLVAFAQACLVARRELEEIATYPARTLHERERVARVMASMSASLMRFQRGYEREVKRFAMGIAEKRAGR